MSLKPSVSLSLNNLCNKVTLTETTNVYMLDVNEGGWGTPNIDTLDVTNAVVNIYSYDGLTLLQSFDLTGLYPLATPPPFDILTEVPWNLADGIYLINYLVTDNSEEPITYYADVQHELFLCNLCNCKDQLVVKLVKACDTQSIEKLKTQVDQLEVFIYGIQSAFSCGDFETATNNLTIASTYCQTLSDCGCGCGGC